MSGLTLKDTQYSGKYIAGIDPYHSGEMKPVDIFIYEMPWNKKIAKNYKREFYGYKSKITPNWYLRKMITRHENKTKNI